MNRFVLIILRANGVRRGGGTHDPDESGLYPPRYDSFPGQSSTKIGVAFRQIRL
jgi:hypothetical protein